MRAVVIGAHLRREDVEPIAEALPVRGLFLSALPIAADQTLGERELLLRVAQLRAQLLERATFIAIRYGFAVWSAEEAESKCAVHLTRWQSLLECHRDRVEMTLKIAASSPRTRPNRHDFASGAEYLKALHEATRAASVDPAFRARVEERIVPLTVQHRWLHRDEKSIELASLVERSRVEEVLAAGESLRGSDVAFLLSGPWPLEVFADDDRE
jgi:hypothetical protein